MSERMWRPKASEMARFANTELAGLLKEVCEAFYFVAEPCLLAKEPCMIVQ